MLVPQAIYIRSVKGATECREAKSICRPVVRPLLTAHGLVGGGTSLICAVRLPVEHGREPVRTGLLLLKIYFCDDNKRVVRRLEHSSVVSRLLRRPELLAIALEIRKGAQSACSLAGVAL
jgi:hypothetical protein